MTLLLRAWRAILRLFANHCIIPSLRRTFFRWSGVKIGTKVFINMDLLVVDDYEGNLVTIKDEVALAPRVTLVAASSPNHSFIGKEYELAQKAPVTLKRGCWIGVNAVILPGVTIGQGAIIGSGSVVTKNVEDFAIMVGIPAKKIGDVRDKPKVRGKNEHDSISNAN